MYRGYRAKHDGVRGPSKGGLWYHPELTRAESIGLATDDLDVCRDGPSIRWREGGRRGGPQERSDAETERLTRRFANETRNCTGPITDIPASDTGTDTQTMARITDAHSVQEAETTPGVAGKPLAAGRRG